MRLYHGTSKKRAHGIRKRGLIPGKESPSDPNFVFHFVTNQTSKEIRKQVFLTPDVAYAYRWASKAAKQDNSKPIILTFNIPDNFFPERGWLEKLEKQKGVLYEVSFARRIPSSFIVK